jgi:hypothetical protein
VQVEAEAAVGARKEEPVVPTRRRTRALQARAGVGIGQGVGDDRADLARPLLGQPALAVGLLQLRDLGLEGGVLLLELVEPSKEFLVPLPKENRRVPADPPAEPCATLQWGRVEC